ncbi:unnamed protein product [Ostreobium quekettii]|uniref:Uncharacterized protein n=1 Tax=Ostreobium quekettii TaxID=121088 RepID=A0A8S1IUM4_9CHLO|nr:unnamed protein product [Ostreobium quekettii]
MMPGRGPRHRRRAAPTVVCSAGPSKPYRVVEGAVRRVNKWLNIRERIARRRADNASDDGEGGWGGRGRREGRRRKIGLRVKANGRKELRVGPASFKVFIPLYELVGIDLRPIAYVRVRVDSRRHKVQFMIDGFSLGVPHLDRHFAVRMKSTMFATPAGTRTRAPGSAGVLPEDDSILADIRDLEALQRAGVPLEEEEVDGVTGELEVPQLSFDGFESTGFGRQEEMHQGTEAVELGGNGCGNEVEIGHRNDEDVRQEMNGTVEMQQEAWKEDTGSSGSQGEGLPGSLSNGVAGGLPDSMQNRIGSLGGEAQQAAGSAGVTLQCKVVLQLQITIPAALSFVPRLVIGSTGRIVIRAVLHSLLPSFLDLVVTDYERWAAGEQSREDMVGKLVSQRLSPRE